MWRVFMGLLLVSCAGDSHHTPFQITLSRGGGFTGVVSGYHLHEGGGIEAWSRMPGKGDSVLWSTTVPADSIDYLRDGLERSGALTTIYRRSGNMTTSVAYTTQDTSFSWSWGSSAPKNLKDWYQQTQRFCVRQSRAQDMERGK